MTQRKILTNLLTIWQDNVEETAEETKPSTLQVEDDACDSCTI